MLEPVTSKSSLSGAHVVRQCERTASRIIDGKAVVITIDRNELHVLNDVATRVWELSDGRSLDAISVEIVREFSVELERASSDVRTFAAQLWEIGALDVTAAEQG